MDHPKPWLRYIEADKIDDETLALDGMKVRNTSKESLGAVDGFIVDAQSGRTYYAVVDAGGWFKSRHFLVPIGQLRLDADRDALIVNLSKDQIHGFPGFDTDQFDALTEADIKRINESICAVFEPDRAYSAADPYSAAWAWPSYQSPEWWMAGAPTVSATREQSTKPPRAAAADRHIRTDDPSPYFDGRAQPGDVIGVETGGERSYVGDTKEDEDQRRKRAEKATDKP